MDAPFCAVPSYSPLILKYQQMVLIFRAMSRQPSSCRVGLLTFDRKKPTVRGSILYWAGARRCISANTDACKTYRTRTHLWACLMLLVILVMTFIPSHFCRTNPRPYLCNLSSVFCWPLPAMTLHHLIDYTVQSFCNYCNGLKSP